MRNKIDCVIGFAFFVGFASIILGQNPEVAKKIFDVIDWLIIIAIASVPYKICNRRLKINKVLSILISVFFIFLIGFLMNHVPFINDALFAIADLIGNLIVKALQLLIIIGGVIVYFRK